MGYDCSPHSCLFVIRKIVFLADFFYDFTQCRIMYVCNFRKQVVLNLALNALRASAEVVTIRIGSDARLSQGSTLAPKSHSRGKQSGRELAKPVPTAVGISVSDRGAGRGVRGGGWDHRRASH